MASAKIFVKREYWELVKEQNQAEKQTDSGQDTKRNGKKTGKPVRWVDAGWLPGTHQSCPIAPLLSWAG